MASDLEFTKGDRQPSTDLGIGARLDLAKAAAHAQAAGQMRKEAEP